MTTSPGATSLGKERERDLWARYVRDRDASVRSELVQHYLEVARRVAARMFSQRTDEALEFSDYLQYARVGLLEAIDRYDPSREAAFSTFATYRMQGAILNGIEKYNERLAQWSFQKRARRDRVDSLTEEGESRTDQDLFEHMANVAIGLAVGHVLEGAGGETGAEEAPEQGPYASLELSRLREQLRVVVDSLPERERQIVTFHYFEHVPFSEIAQIFGLSKGRVSQLHARALDLIRKGYESLGNLDLSY